MLLVVFSGVTLPSFPLKISTSPSASCKIVDCVVEFLTSVKNAVASSTTKLVGISFSTKIGRACYIPIGHKEGKNLEEKIVINKIKPILEDKSIKKIGQNIKFDYIIFYHRGINMNSIEDTMLMSYVLDAGKNRHNMDILSEIHLGHKTIAFKDSAPI